MTQPTLIYISFGSNLDPEKNTRSAVNTIQSSLTDCQLSTIYQCPAVGMDGNDFLNGAIGGFTYRSLKQTRLWLRDIEHQQGRKRTDNKFADRPIDLDLLLFGKQITENLPHPEITEQAYVLKPLADIAATLIHPVVKTSISELNSALLERYPDKYAELKPFNLELSE